MRAPPVRYGKPISKSASALPVIDNGSGTGKRQKSPRLHVAKCVLLNAAKVPAKLHQMSAAGIGRLIQQLETIRHTVLRIVVLVAERRITRHGDVAEPRVARIGRQVQADRLPC